MKGRACAYGRTQRSTTSKEEASRPTASLDAILLSCVIDAMEDRNVATVDIPNAFVQTKLDLKDKQGMKQRVIMKITGNLADLLLKTAPELYEEYVVYEKGQPVIYVLLLKALYGLLLAAVLFYKKLLKDLQSYGFELNPYDPCVVNKTINGEQCTIVWWVDDLKISHYNPQVVDEIVAWLKETYEDEEIGKMATTRGKLHEYLGMKLNFQDSGEVKVDMTDYVEQMEKDFAPYFSKSMKVASSPEAPHLFQV